MLSLIPSLALLVQQPSFTVISASSSSDSAQPFPATGRTSRLVASNCTAPSSTANQDRNLLGRWTGSTSSGIPVRRKHCTCIRNVLVSNTIHVHAHAHAHVHVRVYVCSKIVLRTSEEFKKLCVLCFGSKVIMLSLSLLNKVIKRCISHTHTFHARYVVMCYTAADTMKFTSLKVKTLEEIHREKQSHPQQQTSQQQQQQQQQQQRQEEPSRNPASFQLKTVLQESGVRVSSTSTSKPTTSVPGAQQTAANSGSSIQIQPVAAISAFQTGIFPGNQDSTSIFSPKYAAAAASTEGAKTTGEGVISNSQLHSKFSGQVGTGRDSNKSTPCGSPTKTTPAEDLLSAKAPVVKPISVVQVSRRPQVSVNSKEGETKVRIAIMTYNVAATISH